MKMLSGYEQIFHHEVLWSMRTLHIFIEGLLQLHSISPLCGLTIVLSCETLHIKVPRKSESSYFRILLFIVNEWPLNFADCWKWRLVLPFHLYAAFFSFSLFCNSTCTTEKTTVSNISLYIFKCELFEIEMCNLKLECILTSGCHPE